MTAVRDVMARTGFPKSARLVLSREFQRVFSGATRSADRYFTVLARPNGGAPARLGLAISMRRARTAVNRNRIKRLVRESFRHHRDRLTGLDLVVMGRNAVATASNQELYGSLHRHWDRLSERCKSS